MDGAGYQAVHLAQLQHESPQHHGIVQLFFGQTRRQPFVLAQFDHGVDIAVIDLGRIDDFDIRRNAHAATRRQPVHPPAVAHQHAAGEAALVADDRRFDRARFVALGQDNALIGLARPFHQGMLEGGRAEPTFLDAGQQRFFPIQGHVRGDRFDRLLHPIPIIERDFQIEMRQVKHRLQRAVRHGQHR